MSPVPDVARIRLDNAMLLFDEFVRATARQADAATLRGLERRFAERLQIQPSYWSQIKGRSRQIGERLARQFEQLCRKPAGWMDQPHPEGAAAGAAPVPGGLALPAPGPGPDAAPPSQPQDADERFIVGLVLTYYRRHPQRARSRLLDLLGEVLTPGDDSGSSRVAPASATARSQQAAAPKPPGPQPADDLALWQRSQTGVAPLKRKP
ncbi:MAG: hypothetical protein CFE45_01795 [Burkholderiales bacterium PBB5]|nr:MAG: hypothetical protein CFE45_01795 [Burkholderiales bacterium PBB5]